VTDLPLSRSYNLARLGQAGDEVRFEADQTQRAAVAQFANIVSVERLTVQVGLKKPLPGHFVLAYRVEADVIQSCVVTLASVAAHIDCAFSRKLHLTGTGRQAKASAMTPIKPTDIDLSEVEEAPEEIESSHYDLAGPALEEFFLALDPYPRCPGVEFDPAKAAVEANQSPFAVLKSLKSST
jgi:uncharacterized metal-binding protein YceD (DUF177 family)